MVKLTSTRQIVFLLSVLLLVCSFQNGTTSSKAFVDKEEEQKAFRLLNEIRANPKKYYKELKYDKDLNVQTRALKWNDTLAAVAEAKALDMANRHYYSHIDPEGFGMNYFINKAGYKLNPEWLELKGKNNFESIDGDVKDGEDAIKRFIIDKGVKSLGHRKHLLGIGEWNSSLVDIGIGFVRRGTGSNATTYVSLIIAKHNW